MARTDKPPRTQKGPWECVIVGAGPAGLSAAVYMGRFRRRTLVLDCGDGRWSYGQINHNYLGFPAGVSGIRLHELGRAQAERFGVAFQDAEVTKVGRDGQGFRLTTTRGRHRARTLIWAAGVHDRWPEFERARRLVGRHLFWCIVCDGWRARDLRVLVLGDTDKAVRTTLQFRTYTRRVTLLSDSTHGRRLSSRARAKLTQCGIGRIEGRVRKVIASKERIRRVVLDDGRTLEADILFSLYGSTPRTELLRELPVALDGNGHVRIDDKNRTSLPAFFAAGDVDGKHSHQVISAAAEGAMAAQAANHVLYPAVQRM
jgi:thioredoxin reductase (NADPH)